MGIELNGGSASSYGDAPNSTRASASSTTDRVEQAPSRGGDFYSTYAGIGIRTISPEIKPFLEKVSEQVVGNFTTNGKSDVTIEQVDRFPNAWIFHRNDPTGAAAIFTIFFVSQTDVVSGDQRPASRRLKQIRKRIKGMFGSRPNRIVEMMIVLTDYEPDMCRIMPVAQAIVTTLNVETVPMFRNITIDDIGGTDFYVDRDLNRAKAEAARLSPHGVPDRMESAITITAQPRKSDRRDRRDNRDDDDFDDGDFGNLPFLVIGGFIEVGEWIEDRDNRETGGKYELRYNITTLLSSIPTLGSAAIGLGVLAPMIYNDDFWVSQFARFGKDDPQISWVARDPKHKDRLLELKDIGMVRDFVKTMFHTPSVVLNLKWGRYMIPGLSRLDTQGDGRLTEGVMKDLATFFRVNTPKDAGNLVLGDRWGTKVEGYYGMNNGTLKDTADVDWFTLAAQEGVNVLNSRDGLVMRACTKDVLWIKDRLNVVSRLVSQFRPLFDTTLLALNPGLIRWITESGDRSNIEIIDNAERRDYGSTMRQRSDRFDDARNVGRMVNTGGGGDTFDAADLFDR